MKDNERYLFDLQGYITVENALDAAQLAELNRILDEHIANECDGDMCTHRFGGLLDWGEAYRDLIDNGPVVPYLTEIVDPKFRLDHVYADIIRSGTSPIGATLHGGSTPFNPSQYYRFSDGRMHNGLSVAAYNLADVGPEDGGFGCVPGSHKSNYSLPGEWRNMEEGLQPCVRRVVRSFLPKHCRTARCLGQVRGSGAPCSSNTAPIRYPGLLDITTTRRMTD